MLPLLNCSSVFHKMLQVASLYLHLIDPLRGISMSQVWLSNTRGGSRIFLGGGALVSCSTSIPINHIVFFFLQNTSCSGGEVRTPCTLPLDAPLSTVVLHFEIRPCPSWNLTNLSAICYISSSLMSQFQGGTMSLVVILILRGLT